MTFTGRGRRTAEYSVKCLTCPLSRSYGANREAAADAAKAHSKRAYHHTVQLRETLILYQYSQQTPEAELPLDIPF